MLDRSATTVLIIGKLAISGGRVQLVVATDLCR